jgi:hypothetical protein
MELTLPMGTLTAQRAEIARFYGDLFGWDALDVPILKQTGLLLRTDRETSQFILLTEQKRHMSSPGYDHLGLLYESREEVDALLEKCKKLQEHDERVQIKEYDDLEAGNTTVHAFYVKFLLPIWFDVQVIEHPEGGGPQKGWRWTDATA